MRLHHLEMTAFGPFADPVAVDFDDLSASGVFLLTGATGAGKTSVLDAVCFALYGQVPGDRAGARHLRSDHAAPGVAPQVVLRASVGDRTFRFTRSPAWTRPKRRGTGQTKVQSHVLVEELRGDDWVALTNRLDEAGHLVGDLLGMTATQFTQVAMLPQGRFQAFLRASSSERHAVLQKLFRTDRFEQVERWLVERRVATRRTSEEAGRRVQQVLHRIQEAAAVELPATWGDDLEAAVEHDEVTGWADELLAESERLRHAAATTRDAADEALVAAGAALTAARQSHELRRRAEVSARVLVDLDRRADELDDLRARLTAHRRAAVVAPLAHRAQECRRRADEAATAWHAVRADLGDALGSGDPTRTDLAMLHEQAVAARATAEAFRPRAAELARARTRRSVAETRLQTLAESSAAIDEQIAAHPAVLATARAELTAADDAVLRVPALEHEAMRLDEMVRADGRLVTIDAELVAARSDVAAATDAAYAARDAYLDVREARVNGMAAELAGALAIGCACPVCGSASHPAPAQPRAGAAGRTEEDAARKAYEDAAFVQQGHEVRVATLVAEQTALLDRLGQADRAALPGRAAEARRSLHDAREVARRRDERATAVDALVHQLDDARDRRTRVVADTATAQQELEAAEASIATLSAELKQLLDGAAPDLDALVARRAEQCARTESALAAFVAHADLSAAAEEADTSAATAAADAGFPNAATAAAAVLADRAVSHAESELAAAEAARLAAEQTLAEPEVRAAVHGDLPDLDVLVVSHRLATEHAQSAAAGLATAGARADRLAALVESLRARLAAWAPLRADHDLVAGLAQVVEGKGPDNPLRIRLAAFVLSERLRQVVDAANERLARMTEQRYSLEHTDDRGAGEQRGGLSLRVRDDWNGVPRDPATLSGGETFVVSLALALGLADTVAHEAGGTDIDTLFIDEGFGSLDPDTLEDVMDTLDTLRDGGRVVGLVSHVPELRNRITTQLEVRKHRQGSTVHTVLAGG